ncbi:MAG TPA: hypothetical protein VGD37_28600, partial [Kofleriaceae bacterium]
MSVVLDKIRSDTCSRRCHHYVLAIWSVLVACSTPRISALSQSGVLTLDFEAKNSSVWIEQASPNDKGGVIVRAGHDPRLQIISARDQHKKLVRRVDAFSLRGKRILAQVKTDVQPREESAFASMRISAERADGRIDAWDFATSQRARTKGTATLQAAIDVPEDAASLSVELAVKGDADAQFGTPHLEIATSDSRDLLLTEEMTARLESMARLVGYLRFFHPSDEVAHLAWPDFEAEAVRQVLTTKSHAELQRALQWVVERSAPTARLHEDGARSGPRPPPRGAGTRLTRWVRIGSGDGGDPYSAFRSGITEPAEVGVTLLKTVPSQGCRHATVRLAARVGENAPVAELYIIPRRGSRSPSVASHVLTQSEAGAIDGDIPSDVTDISYGVRVGGVGVLDVMDVGLACNQKMLGSFASGGAPDIFGTAFHLYSVTPIKECVGCLRVARHLENAYEASRDEIDVSIGQGLRLQMPLALWTDGTRTFPEAPPARYVPRPLPPGDPASRLASAIDIWVTLRWFYPYFDDLGIDWNHELTRALAASAEARSSDQLFLALSRLVAGLRDDHAVIYRPDYDNGILPLLFRELDSKLYFVKGIGEYSTVLPRGSTLVSLDGVPADVVIKQISSTISAATPAWLHAYLPLTLGDGPTGIMLSVVAKQPDGELATISVPRVARSRYVAQKREDRAASGTEVATGVYYLDLSRADDAMWKDVLPKLGSSRAVICDVRDGASPAGFLILAHFIDHEIKSPYWDKPISSVLERKYERTQASIFPL